MDSTIAVPIKTSLFLDLCEFLKSEQSSADPVSIVELSVSYWLDNASWKQDDLIPDRKIKRSRGLIWKSVFLPDKTLLRIKTRAGFAYAEVDGDFVSYDGREMSVAEFANTATGTVRNAWRDVWIKRPSDTEWLLANDLRSNLPRPKQTDSMTGNNHGSPALAKSRNATTGTDGRTYVDNLIDALRSLGGTDHRKRVIDEVRRIRQARGASVPETFEQTVQGAFESRCIDSENLQGRKDDALFCWPNGKNEGTWGLIEKAVERYIARKIALSL